MLGPSVKTFSLFGGFILYSVCFRRFYHLPPLHKSVGMPPKKLRASAKVSKGRTVSITDEDLADVRNSTDKTVENAAAVNPSSSTSWDHLDWKPIQRLPSSFLGSHATILLPFSGVGQEELPEVLGCFGGIAKVAAIIKNPHNPKRKLTFDIHRPDSLKNTLQCSNPLSSTSSTNSFVLRFTVDRRSESEAEKKKRAKKELSAVARARGVQPKPLPFIVTDISFLHYIPTTFEFDQLYDYAMCPAIVENRTEINPSSIRMTDIVPYIVPSFPPAEIPETAEPQDYLYFPTLKFTNQSSFAGNDYIPSLYTDSLSAHETTVKRIRKNFARVVKWTVGDKAAPVVPLGPFEAAQKNLEERVLKEHPEFLATAMSLMMEQPLWLRHDFYEALQNAHPELLREHRRYVLPVIAFRYSNGPWRKMWCRMGFDPTTEPTMRRLQVVDFRIHQQTIQRKRTSNLKSKPLKSLDREKVLQNVVKRLSEAGMTKGLQFILPFTKLAKVEEIREILDSRSYMKNVCDMKEGFFREGTMEEIRFEIIKAIEREDPGLLEFPEVIRDLQKGNFFPNVVFVEPIAVDESDDEDDTMARADETEEDIEIVEDNDQTLADENSFEPSSSDMQD